MSKINLLPWRDEVKKILNNQFYAQSVLAFIIGLIIAFWLHTYLLHRIGHAGLVKGEDEGQQYLSSLQV